MRSVRGRSVDGKISWAHIVGAKSLGEIGIDSVNMPAGNGGLPTYVTLPLPPEGLVDSYCWCDKHRVKVTLEEVRAGQTRSCGRAACEKIAAQRTPGQTSG